MSSDFSELLAQSNALCKNTLMETLNIEFVDVDHESITAKMPVNTPCLNFSCALGWLSPPCFTI